MKNILFRCFGILLLASVVSCSQQQNVDELLETAQDRLRSGEYNSAVIILKNVIKEKHDLSRAREMLADAYLAIGDYAGAEKEYRRAIEFGQLNMNILSGLGRAMVSLSKHNEVLEDDIFKDAKGELDRSVVLAIYGDSYLGRGDIEKAKQNYVAALTLNQNNLVALLGTAKIHIKNNEYTEANVALDSAAKLAPENHEIMLIRGAMYMQKNEHDKAELEFHRIIKSGQKTVTHEIFKAFINVISLSVNGGDLSETKNLVNEFSRKFPNHPVPKYYEALLDFNSKNYEEAQVKLQQVMKKLPGFMPAYFLLGATHFASGNLEQANIVLTQYIAYVPTNIQARKMLAAVRFRLNKPSGAFDALSPVLSEESNDAQLLAMAGQAAAAFGDYAKSTNLYQQASRLQPSNNMIREELAKVYMRKGSYDEALELLDINSKTDETIRADLLITQTLIKKGDFDSAREQIKNALNKKGDSAELYFMLGFIELNSGIRDIAVAHFKKSISLSSGFIPAKLYLANIEIENGNLASAKDLLSEIISVNSSNLAALNGMAQISEIEGDRQSAEAWLQQAINQNPDKKLPHLVLGYYYLKKHEYKKAMEISEKMGEVKNDHNATLFNARVNCVNKKYDLCLKAYENIEAANPKHAHSIYLEHATELYKIGRYNRAKEILAKLMNTNPDDLYANRILVEIDLATHEYEKAIDRARQIVNKHPKNEIGHLLLGNIYIKQGMYLEAANNYKSANEINETPIASVKYADTLLRMEKITEAELHIKDSLEKYSDNRDLRLMLAIIYDKKNAGSEALSIYEELLADFPNDAQIINNASYSYLERKPEKSLELAKRAIELEPNDPAIIDTLAWALVKNNQPEKAEPYLAKLYSSTDNATIHYHYAINLYLLGRHIEAKTVLKELISKNERFPELSEAQYLFEELNRMK